jgi:hypothetical protein
VRSGEWPNHLVFEPRITMTSASMSQLSAKDAAFTARRFDLREIGAQLVHNNLQMRCLSAIGSALSHSKQMKHGKYEQGRKN